MSQLVVSEDTFLTAEEQRIKRAFLQFSSWAGENTELLMIGRKYGFELGLSDDAREALRLVDCGTGREKHAAENIGRFSWACQNK